MLILLLHACGTADSADAPVASDSCEEGATVDTGAGGAVDPLDALADCTPLAAGDRLDVADACADGVCLGDTLEEADAAYGSAAFCLVVGDGTVCFWGDGVLGTLADADADGVPDPGARIWVLQVLDPWDGSSAEGLGLGLGLGCFVDALGTPDSLSFTAVDGALVPAYAEWTAAYVSAYDVQDASFAFVPDGKVESIVFKNALYE